MEFLRLMVTHGPTHRAWTVYKKISSHCHDSSLLLLLMDLVRGDPLPVTTGPGLIAEAARCIQGAHLYYDGVNLPIVRS